MDNITKKYLRNKRLYSDQESKLLPGNPHKNTRRTFAKSNDWHDTETN